MSSARQTLTTEKNIMSNQSVDENKRCPEQKLDSPKFEFRQPPDERAELLILLCGKRWALICRRERGYRVLWE